MHIDEFRIETVKKKHLTLLASFAMIVEAGVKEKTLTCKMEVSGVNVTWKKKWNRRICMTFMVNC
jgi:hypothetical protein